MPREDAGSPGVGLSPFAQALRRARAEKSLSVLDVAKALLLSDLQVLGLEGDDPSPFYTASYAARAAGRYAAFLAVDVSLIADSPFRQPADAREPAPRPVRTLADVRPARPMRPTALRLLGLAAVIAAATAGALWFKPQPSPPLAPVPLALPAPAEAPPRAEPIAGETLPPNVEAAPQVESPSPASGAQADAQAEDDTSHRIYLVVTAPATVNIRDRSGALLLGGVQQPDKGRRILGEPPFAVTVSKADAVEVYYKGQRVRPDFIAFEGITVTLAP